MGDDPDREHRRHFPSCPFVQLVINSRLQTETDATAVATNSQQQYKNPSTVSKRGSVGGSRGDGGFVGQIEAIGEMRHD